MIENEAAVEWGCLRGYRARSRAWLTAPARRNRLAALEHAAANRPSAIGLGLNVHEAGHVAVCDLDRGRLDGRVPALAGNPEKRYAPGRSPSIRTDPSGPARE